MMNPKIVSEAEYVERLEAMSKDWKYGEVQREAIFDALRYIKQAEAVPYFRAMRSIMQPYIALIDGEGQ